MGLSYQCFQLVPLCEPTSKRIVAESLREKYNTQPYRVIVKTLGTKRARTAHRTRRDDVMERVRRCLCDAREPLTAQALSDRLGVKRVSIHRVLAKLYARGVITPRGTAVGTGLGPVPRLWSINV